MCERSYAILEQYYRHVESAHLGVRVQCEECDAHVLENDLLQHMTIHAGTFECPACLTTFGTRRQLRQHCYRTKCAEDLQP